MTNKTSKPRSPTAWIDILDPEDIDEAYEEATVDANGDEEQQTGLIEMAQDSLVFPFPARVMGQEVQIIGAEWAEHDAFGLDLIVEINGQKQRVAARSVELFSPLPEGAVFLAAYLAWRQRP